MEAEGNKDGTAILFNQQWETLPTDLSTCSACHDIIFGDMHIPYFTSGPIRADIDIILCESCYNALENE